MLTLNECNQSIDVTWHSRVMIKAVLCVNFSEQREVAQNLRFTYSTSEIIIFFLSFCRGAETG